MKRSALPLVLGVYGPEDREATMTAWMHAVQAGEPTDFHHRFRRHDGVYRWFHSRVEPTIDQNGKVMRWYGLFTDVDERQRAEDALRSTERKLRLFIDAIPALVFCTTPDGEPSYFNKRMTDFIGKALNSFKPLPGGSLGSVARLAIIHPDDLASAAVDVLSAINAAAPYLPPNIPYPPTIKCGAGLDARVTRFAVTLPCRHAALGFSIHG